MAAGSDSYRWNSLVRFVTLGTKGTSVAAQDAAKAAKSAQTGGFWAAIGGFFSEMTDKGFEMLGGENRAGEKTALGTIMRPVLYIMAAVGIYKLVNAAMDYFGVRSERKKVQNVNESVMLHADSMARMANAEEMRMQADAIEAGLEPETTTFREKHPPRSPVLVTPQAAKDFRTKLETKSPELAMNVRGN